MSAGQRVGQGHGRVQAGAALVQGDDVQIGADLHLSGIGRQRAGQQAEQRGLAGAVRPDDAHAVAAQNTVGEVAHDHPVGEGFRHLIGDDHQLAGNFGLPRFHPQPRAAAALFLQPTAQRVQIAQALDVALAPRGNPVAQPILLHHQLAAELVAVAFLLLQHLVAPPLEMGEAAIQRAGGAAVQPDDPLRQAFQQPPVMADQHDAGPQRGEFFFQPLDRRQVQMVGRLVQQQDVGRGRQTAGQRGAAGLAAGQAFGVFLAGQAKLAQQIMRAVFVIARPQPGRDIGGGAGIAGQVRLLRQIADGGAGLGEAAAAIGLGQAGGDLQQGGFARAVAPHQADTVPRGDRKLGPR